MTNFEAQFTILENTIARYILQCNNAGLLRSFAFMLDRMRDNAMQKYLALGGNDGS